MNIFSGTNNFREVLSLCLSILKNNIVTGNSVKEYENKFSKIIDSKQTYSFASGRMSFFAILKCLNIGGDDEVIVPAYTCVVVPNAVQYCGASVVYCDINIRSFNSDDVELIKSKITNNTKAICIQHTFGNAFNFNEILDLANSLDIAIIEDCAHSLGCMINDKYVGTIGHFGFFSTDRTKVMNTGVGGLVSVNDERFVDKFNAIYSNTPTLGGLFSLRLCITFIINFITLKPNIYKIGKYIHALLFRVGLLTYLLDEGCKVLGEIKYPYPAKMSNSLCGIGISQLELLEKNLINRRKKAKFYNDILEIYDYNYMKSTSRIFLRYSFLLKNRDYWEKRFERIIELSIWFKDPIYGRKNIGNDYIKEDYPVSMFVSQHIFNLPTHNLINEEKMTNLLIELKKSGDIIQYKEL